MKAENRVFIAVSLDGCIADRNGGLEWLNLVPNPGQHDMGYAAFIKGVDAILMGRHTFDTVCSFGMEWPYSLPVFVLSRTMDAVPEAYEGKAEVLRGPLSEILGRIHRKGYYRLYIDGGLTIQEFLKEDLIDELTITTMPILLGGGVPLFSELPGELEFEHVDSKVYLDAVVQNTYRRKRSG